MQPDGAAHQRITKQDRERRFRQARRINARWRLVEGQGRFAIYRATCGNPKCPGHLGDLSFDDKAHVDLLIAFGDKNKKDAKEVVRRVAAEPAVSPRGTFTGWNLRPFRRDIKSMLNVENDIGPTQIYMGFADTGFSIRLNPGKRSRDNTEVGRRDVDPNRPQIMKEPREIIGEDVKPGDHVWCPIPSCGALNYVDWPDPLQDPQAR